MACKIDYGGVCIINRACERGHRSADTYCCGSRIEQQHRSCPDAFEHIIHGFSIPHSALKSWYPCIHIHINANKYSMDFHHSSFA